MITYFTNRKHSSFILCAINKNSLLWSFGSSVCVLQSNQGVIHMTAISKVIDADFRCASMMRSFSMKYYEFISYAFWTSQETPLQWSFYHSILSAIFLSETKNKILRRSPDSFSFAHNILPYQLLTIWMHKLPTKGHRTTQFLNENKGYESSYEIIMYYYNIGI